MSPLERIKTAIGCALFTARLYYPQPPKARNPYIWAVIMVPSDAPPFGYRLSFDEANARSLFKSARAFAQDRGWGCRLERYSADDSADSEDG